jgi:NitT/TauT family transport system permease protein
MSAIIEKEPPAVTAGTTSARQLQLRKQGRRGALSKRTWSPWTLLGVRVLFGALLLGMWQGAVRAELVDPDFVPSPSEVAAWIVQAAEDGSIYRNVIATGIAMLLSFVIGSSAGIGCGVIFGRFERVAAVISPFVLFLNALPRVALAPLFILYLGIGVWSKVSVGASIVFFVLLLNTLAGIRSVDSDHTKLARLNRMSTRQIFWKVTLPTAIPAIFAGLKLAAVYSLLGVVVSEMVASTEGLGQLIIYNTNTFEMPGVYGTLLILATLAMVLSSVMNVLESRLLAWQQHGDR